MALPPPVPSSFPGITRLLSTEMPKKQSKYTPRLYPDPELEPNDPRNSPWPAIAELLLSDPKPGPVHSMYPNLEVENDEFPEKDPKSEPESA